MLPRGSKCYIDRCTLWLKDNAGRHQGRARVTNRECRVSEKSIHLTQPLVLLRATPFSLIDSLRLCRGNGNVGSYIFALS